MARLNEPPAPAAESIDALKRRFIRQNREIARVNSNQSIRIRNLESEISRLLAENIALREEAIAAKAEAEKYASSKRLERELLYVKEKFEAKLAEVHALVGDLGRIPERAARRSSVRRRKSGLCHEAIKSPVDPDWRNRQTASGIDRDAQEARMPAIVEDKYYPRRTLDANEVQSVHYEGEQDPLDSPDLGPPPVVHFEDDELAQSNAPSAYLSTLKRLDEEAQAPIAAPTVNLETRRKRRTSSLLQDMPKMTETSQMEPKKPTGEPEKASNANTTTLQQPAKPSAKSAKRKLDVSELEDTSSQVNKDLDDFIFQRRPSMSKPAVKSSRFSRSVQNISKENSTEVSVLSPTKQISARKILAPKSTNSPSKRRVGGALADPGKNDIQKSDPQRSSQEKSETKPSSIRLPEAQPKPEDLNAPENPPAETLPPKTPAVELAGLLSPSSVPTEPSTKNRPKQEMASINSVEDVLNGSIGRGSRRARAAVSYAEPNLRDKMRRPGKELVGAIEGIGKSRSGDRSSLNGVYENMLGDGSINAIAIASSSKIEETDELRRKDALDPQRSSLSREEAPSPLRGKISGNSRPAGERLKRRGLANGAELEEDEIDTALSQLAIFDPPSSSPIAEEKLATRPSATSSQDKAVLRTRRHSMQSQPFKAPASLQRPSSAASIRGEIPSKEVAVKRSASVTTLPSATSLKSTSTTRKPVERASSNTAMTRRKSMMI